METPMRASEWEAAQESMYEAGIDDGGNAADWCIDGNTSDEAKTRVKQGLDDCDPAILDSLPHLQLGQWAGDPTIEDLISEHTGINVELTPEEIQDLWIAYSDGWYEGMHARLEGLVS